MSIWDRVREFVFYGPRWMQIDESKGAAERSLADQHLGADEYQRITDECFAVDELNREPDGTALSDRQSRLGLLGDERTVRDALRPFAEREERSARMDEAERQAEIRQSAQRELAELVEHEKELQHWIDEAPSAGADSKDVEHMRAVLDQVRAHMDEVRRDAGIRGGAAATSLPPIRPEVRDRSTSVLDGDQLVDDMTKVPTAEERDADDFATALDRGDAGAARGIAERHGDPDRFTGVLVERHRIDVDPAEMSERLAEHDAEGSPNIAELPVSADTAVDPGESRPHRADLIIDRVGEREGDVDGARALINATSAQDATMTEEQEARYGTAEQREVLREDAVAEHASEPAGPAGITTEDERIVEAELGRYGATDELDAVKAPSVESESARRARIEHEAHLSHFAMMGYEHPEEWARGSDPAAHDTEPDDVPEAGR
jgi:hypothetical protein